MLVYQKIRKRAASWCLRTHSSHLGFLWPHTLHCSWPWASPHRTAPACPAPAPSPKGSPHNTNSPLTLRSGHFLFESFLTFRKGNLLPSVPLGAHTVFPHATYHREVDIFVVHVCSEAESSSREESGLLHTGIFADLPDARLIIDAQRNTCLWNEWMNEWVWGQTRDGWTAHVHLTRRVITLKPLSRKFL